MKRTVGIVLLAALVLLAACGAPKAKPTLAVTAEQVGTDLVIKMETGNFEIGKDGHAHLRLDGGPEVMPNTAAYTVPNIKPGKHKVWVELSDPGHVPLKVQQEIEVETK